MEKGKKRWLEKYDYLINNRILISVIFAFWLFSCIVLSFLIAFGYFSIYWITSFAGIFVFVYFLYLNNNSMVSISKDLPKELKNDFNEIRIFMNSFLFVPLKRVKKFRLKVVNWKQEENK